MRVAVLLLLVLALYVAYEAVRFYAYVVKSRDIVARSVPFERADGKLHMLVLGDSTAASVGSQSEDSVPGRLSLLLNASAENHAISGARVDDVLDQIEKIQRTSYDLILLQVGANDVMRFSRLPEVEKSLSEVLEQTGALSDRVIVLTAGRIGDAIIFPWFVRPFVNARTADVRDIFIEQTNRRSAVYVDIYARKDPFALDPDRYYAPDMLHPSGEGYGFWFAIVREYVEKNWPELTR